MKIDIKTKLSKISKTKIRETKSHNTVRIDHPKYHIGISAYPFLSISISPKISDRSSLFSFTAHSSSDYKTWSCSMTKTSYYQSNLYSKRFYEMDDCTIEDLIAHVDEVLTHLRDTLIKQLKTENE